MATMTQVRQYTEFAAVIGQEFGRNVREGSIEEVLRLARRLQRAAEDNCNYGLTPRQEKAAERLEARVTAIVEAWGGSANFQGDPRGFVVKILLPSGRYNTWGGASEGWGVPS